MSTAIERVRESLTPSASGWLREDLNEVLKLAIIGQAIVRAAAMACADLDEHQLFDLHVPGGED